MVEYFFEEKTNEDGTVSLVKQCRYVQDEKEYTPEKCKKGCKYLENKDCTAEHCREWLDILSVCGL